MMDAGDDPVAREHVTGYFKLHPDFVPIARAAPYPPLAREGGRLTIDTPDDLAFVEAVHARLDAKAGEASLADLLLLLEREPELRAINAHVKQKPIVARRRAGADPLRWRRQVRLWPCQAHGGAGARLARPRKHWRRCSRSMAREDALAPIRRAGFEASMIDRRCDFAA